MPLTKAEKEQLTAAVRAWLKLGVNPIVARVASPYGSRHLVTTAGMARRQMYFGEFATRPLAQATADRVNRFISTIQP